MIVVSGLVVPVPVPVPVVALLQMPGRMIRLSNHGAWAMRQGICHRGKPQRQQQHTCCKRLNDRTDPAHLLP
jgi:hypothetical protein